MSAESRGQGGARPRPKRRLLKCALWFSVGLSALFAVLSLLFLVISWRALGKAPEGERLARMQASPQHQGSVFENPQILYNDIWGSVTTFLDISPVAEADFEFPIDGSASSRLKSPAESLRVTWLGHSTTLIEVAGLRVLTDPMFGPSPSPISSIGPQRWYPPPVPLDEIGHIDLVLISHDHYDHLDQPTIERIAEWDATFVAPLGVGAHLEYWGVPSTHIVEMDWWQEKHFGPLRLVCTPARHASGRQLLDQNRTLWAGYALISGDERVFFGGDTGLFDDMQKIGDEYGPFDIVMIEVGAYNAAWPDWHIGPEQALVGHQMLRGNVFMPIHWGLFNLATHGWTEPIERLMIAAQKKGATIVTPRPGQSVDPKNPLPPERWWPELPFKTTEEAPITSTRAGDPEHRYPQAY